MAAFRVTSVSSRCPKNIGGTPSTTSRSTTLLVTHPNMVSHFFLFLRARTRLQATVLYCPKTSCFEPESPRISPNQQSKPVILHHCSIIRDSTRFLGSFPLAKKARFKP